LASALASAFHLAVLALSEASASAFAFSACLYL
jgi:hypothetical protein